jgi:hypothetical protein
MALLCVFVVVIYVNYDAILALQAGAAGPVVLRLSSARATCWEGRRGKTGAPSQ